MDLVIPYQRHFNNQDLTWATASMRKHLKGLGNIFVIGDDPELPDTIHVPFKDGPNVKGKEFNIYSKTRAACNDPRVSDDFLFANDDHFLLDDYNIEEFPAYYSLTWPQEGQYGQTTVVNTREMLGPADMYFDIHCPIIYNKHRFIKAFENIKWFNYGYCIKTVYSYLAGNGDSVRIQTPDYKIRERLDSEADIKLLLTGARWFSTGGPVYTEALTSYLNELYGTNHAWAVND